MDSFNKKSIPQLFGISEYIDKNRSYETKKTRKQKTKERKGGRISPVVESQTLDPDTVLASERREHIHSNSNKPSVSQ